MFAVMVPEARNETAADAGGAPGPAPIRVRGTLLRGNRQGASPAAMTMRWLAAMPETGLGSPDGVTCGDDHERCRSSS